MLLNLGRVILILFFLIFGGVYFIEVLGFDTFEERIIVQVLYVALIIFSLLGLAPEVRALASSKEKLNLKEILRTYVTGRSAKIIALTFLFIPAATYLGFFVTAFVYMLVSYAVFESAPWRSRILITLISLIVAYLGFVVLLRASIPPGVLF